MLASKEAICSAINCSNNKGENPELTFFTFPKDEERSKQWINNMKTDDFTIGKTKQIKLCSLHFEDDQFVTSKKKKLLQSAVPTLFDVPEENGRCSRLRKQLLRECSFSPYPKQRKVLERGSELPGRVKPEEPYSDHYGDADCSVEDLSVVFDNKGMGIPFARIKEEYSADYQDDNGGLGFDARESKLYQPTFVDVGESDVVAEEEMMFENSELESSSYKPDPSPEVRALGLEHTCCANEVDPFTTKFSCVDDGVDPFQPQEVPPGLDGLQLVSDCSGEMIVPDRNWEDVLDDTLLLKRCSRGGNNETEEQPPAPDAMTTTTVASSPMTLLLLQRVDWLQQQQAKVEEHIREVRHQDRLEESHSLQCEACVTGNCYSSPGTKPSEQLIPSPSRSCLYCNVNCLNEAAYNIHLQICTEKPSKTEFSKINIPFVCSLCGEVFDNSATHVRHIKICCQNFESSSTPPPFPPSSISLPMCKDGNYTCALCKEHFVSETARTKHILKCFENKPYLCCACGKRFHDSDMRTTHVKVIHENENLCGKCGLKFSNKQDLSSHLQLLCDQRIVTYPCRYCNQRYIDKRSRADHHTIHVEEILFFCTPCQKGFSSRSHLNAHLLCHSTMKQSNNTDSPEQQSSSPEQHLRYDKLQQLYMCTMCGSKFFNETTGTKHMKNCYGNKPCLCLTCGKRFRHEEIMTSHIMSVHGYTCCDCGLKFAGKIEVESHQQLYCVQRSCQTSHVEENLLFSCVACGERVSSRRELQAHRMCHSRLKQKLQESYICALCRENFVDKATQTKHIKICFDMHISSVHGKKSTDSRFTCRLCSLVFISCAKVMAHMKVHFKKSISETCQFEEQSGKENEIEENTTLPYCCPICDTKFGDDDSKQNHINSVHVRKLRNMDSRYVCCVCNLVFISFTEVILHVKGHLETSILKSYLSRKDVVTESKGPEYIK